jgi:hypothetical protein
MEAMGAQEAAARAENQRQRNLEGIATGVEQMFDVAAQATPLIIGEKKNREAYKELMNQKMLMGEDVFNTKVAEQGGIDITGKTKKQIGELVMNYILNQDAAGTQSLLNIFQQGEIESTPPPATPPPPPSILGSPKLGYYDPITGEYIEG